MTKLQRPYVAYVNELTVLASDVTRGSWRRIEEDVHLALNGQAAERLRSLVPRQTRRTQGAFFTTGAVRESFSKLLKSDETHLEATRFWDPTCGAGDLLIAASAYLPVTADLAETLRLWTRCLRGSDLQPEFVEATRLRLFLAAAKRTRMAGHQIESPNLGSLRSDAFRLVRVEDGLSALRVTRSFPGHLLLNPPYGSMPAEEHCGWATGTVSQAAVFTLTAIQALAVGQRITAVLPDVLRSGSRYEQWRSLVARYADFETIQTHGVFDAHTDIHVFLISALRHRYTRGSSTSDASWWPKREDCERLADYFEVRVGPVVDNRDPHEGPSSPFLTARALPSSGDVGPPTRERQFTGRLVKPPFVALRRTSRPGQGAGGEARGMGVIVTGPTAIAVDNHIITAQPLDGSEETCRKLIKGLASPSVASWLDERIRCRHLTVSAVREIPWAATW